MEVAVVPLRGVRGPRPLKTTGHRVTAHAACAVIHPTQALLVDLGAFRRWP